MNPKVNFQIATNKEEAWCLYKFRKEINKDYSNTRKVPYFQIDLPEEIKKLLTSDKTFEEMEPELSKFIDSIKPSLDQSRIDKSRIEEIKQEWEKIEPLFFEEMQKIIGGEEFFKDFRVFLIFSVCGHYEKGTNKVYVTMRKSMQAIAAVCAEEILHLYYWKVFEKLFGTGKFTHEQWQLSEVIPSYLLSENPKFEKFGWDKWKRNECYHWIPELRKALDSIWDNREDFKDFMVKADKIIQDAKEKKYNQQLKGGSGK